jgi:hypothetical protein
MSTAISRDGILNLRFDKSLRTPMSPIIFSVKSWHFALPLQNGVKFHNAGTIWRHIHLSNEQIIAAFPVRQIPFGIPNRRGLTSTFTRECDAVSKKKIVLGLFLLAITAWAGGCWLMKGRGKMFDNWESGNTKFRVKITRYEEGVWTGGANYVFQSAFVGSDEWKQIMTVRQDDPVPIPRRQVHFIDDQIGYVFMGCRCSCSRLSVELLLHVVSGARETTASEGVGKFVTRAGPLKLYNRSITCAIEFRESCG